MTKTGFPSDQQDKFLLRLPDGMRERIRAAADRNKRSMTSEIVATLDEAYPAQAEDFGTMFLAMFDDLNALADEGRERDLTNRINLMNHRLAMAGHGKIQFYLIPGPPLGVGSRNVDVSKRLGRLEDAVQNRTNK